jgi:hypothetical protein
MSRRVSEYSADYIRALLNFGILIIAEMESRKSHP